MLESLHIVNFAVIEEAVIDLAGGATVFTGETGAGKSILMDALAVLTGRRASAEFIRNGADFFRVEGVFTADKESAAVLSSMGIETEGDIVISRRMNRAGRSLSTVNGTFCSVRQLEELGRKLVRLHEQNDNDQLLSPDFCRRMVDQSSRELSALREEYASLYKTWKEEGACLADFAARKQEHERRLDVLQWEIGQIDAASLKEGEDEEIAQTLTRMENHEKIYRALQDALEILEADDGVEARLSEAGRQVARAAAFDDRLSPVSESLSSAVYAVEDAVRTLESFADDADFSEEELNRLQERDETLSDLKRKYGPTLSDVFSYQKKAQDEYDRLHDMIFENDEAEASFQKRTDAVIALAGRLNALRRKEGDRLCRFVEGSLRDMGMVHARMALRIVPSETPTSSGADEMEFDFSANPGEPMKPLRKTASGGEMSRISLALEIAASHLFSSQTLVFDEIDTGISGQAALQVAEKIRALSQSVQILCITHLPQTAAMADCHYRLEKQVRDGRTYTTARRLDKKGHLMSIAQMMSGTDVSENALRSAEELCRRVKKE